MCVYGVVVALLFKSVARGLNKGVLGKYLSYYPDEDEVICPPLTVSPHFEAQTLSASYEAELQRPRMGNEANKARGIWNLRAEKGMADEVWQTLCLAFIGEQFACSLPRHDEVCGVSVKPGPSTSNQMIFQLWHRDECHKGAIYDRLKTVLSKVTDMNTSFCRSIVEELRRAEKEARN